MAPCSLLSAAAAAADDVSSRRPPIGKGNAPRASERERSNNDESGVAVRAFRLAKCLETYVLTRVCSHLLFVYIYIVGSRRYYSPRRCDCSPLLLPSRFNRLFSSICAWSCSIVASDRSSLRERRRHQRCFWKLKIFVAAC